MHPHFFDNITNVTVVNASNLVLVYSTLIGFQCIASTDIHLECSCYRLKLALIATSHKLDCIGAVRHRQEPAFSLGRSQRPHTRTLDIATMNPHAALVCGRMVFTQ